MSKLPIIYSAHHASYNFGKFDSRVNLSLDQKIRFSDYGTDLTVPRNGVLSLIANYARGLVDLNRSEKDSDIFPEYDFGKPQRTPIWKKDENLTDSERIEILEKVYRSYHGQILKKVADFDNVGFVIAWDNTASEFYSPESKKLVNMKPIILSNRGLKNSTSKDPKSKEDITCESDFLEYLGKTLSNELSKRKLPSQVYYNWEFRGGHVCKRYNSSFDPNLNKKAKIYSFQIEYNSDITHDPVNLKPNLKKINDLRQAFEESINNVYHKFYK